MVESKRSPGVDLGAPAEPQVVRILVKSPWQKEEFLLQKDTSVREFKARVARHFSGSPASFSTSPDHVALVYAGRLLKDGWTLRQHGLHLDREATVHAVIRAPRGARPQHASAAPSGAVARDRLWELTASLGLKTANFAEFQSHLLSNPQAMLQLLESPFTQRKLSCPGLMRELVSDSPQVRQAMQSAPEIGRFFNSPEGMRLVVQLARNPAAVREILMSPPQAAGCLGNAPSGDNNGARPDALAGMPGLLEKAVRNRTGSPLGLDPSSGPQALLDGGEQPGPARDRLPSAKGWPPKPGAQNPAAGGRERSQDESRGASAAVRNLLHQIMKHLLQSMAGSAPRKPSGPGLSAPAVAPTSQRRAAGPGSPRDQAALQAPALLQQQQQQQQQLLLLLSTEEALLASWSPSEIRGLLEIQRRLRALVAEEAPAERRGRPERPARRAHSITSLCDLVPPAAGGGGPRDLSAQQVLQTLLGSSILAGAKAASRPRGSSAQPSAEQKRMYKL